MKLKYLLILITTALTCTLFTNCNYSKKTKSTGAEYKSTGQHMVVAYVAGYRDFDFTKIDASGLTHINYAFANINNGRVIFDTTKIDGKRLTPNDLKALNSLKTKNPALKILVSVGGWTWSGGFSDAALTKESRQIFAQSCADFVDKYNLDGIDLDWEYPNQTGAGNKYRPEDVQNFTLMLKAVREKLDQLSETQDKREHYLLTIATGADENYVRNCELDKLHKYIDFLNIMTYDFYNGLHNVTGHHSNYLPSSQPGLDKNSVVNAVDMHIKAGFPAEKINLGIPFYGRIWKGVKSNDNNVLFREAETVGTGIDYNNFSGNINNNGYVRYWDDSAKAPYLWNPQSKTFISYEDEKSIAFKIQYIKEKGFGGVMFWEYSADDNNRLLNAVSDNLKLPRH